MLSSNFVQRHEIGPERPFLVKSLSVVHHYRV